MYLSSTQHLFADNLYPLPTIIQSRTVKLPQENLNKITPKASVADGYRFSNKKTFIAVF